MIYYLRYTLNIFHLNSPFSDLEAMKTYDIDIMHDPFMLFDLEGIEGGSASSGLYKNGVSD